MKSLKRYARALAFMAVVGVLSAHGMNTDDMQSAPAQSEQLPADNSAPSIEKPKVSPHGLQMLLNMLEMSRLRTQRNYPSISPNPYMLKSIAKKTHASPDNNDDNGDDINLSGNEKKLIKRAGSGFFSAAWGDLQPMIMELVNKYGASMLKWFR
jgi:hypothetical protein